MRCASACIFTGHEIWSGDYSTRSTVKTRHRIKYAKVDADTGEEVSNEDIMKGYKVDTDTYIEVKDELDNIALESTRTIARACHRDMHWQSCLMIGSTEMWR